MRRFIAPFVLIEADTILEDDLVAHITSDKFDGKSVWFTNGKFKNGQYGGILKADDNANIVDIRLVSNFEGRYEGYKKLTGLMSGSSGLCLPRVRRN